MGCTCMCVYVHIHVYMCVVFVYCVCVSCRVVLRPCAFCAHRFLQQCAPIYKSYVCVVCKSGLLSSAIAQVHCIDFDV